MANKIITATTVGASLSSAASHILSLTINEVLSNAYKKLAQHIGAIKLFICHDNRTRAAA